MARYKEYNYSQGKFIPIHFDKQIIPGTIDITSGPIHPPGETKGKHTVASLLYGA